MGKELAGKIALITGAGSGIGRGAAVALAQEGALVAVTDIDADAITKTLCLIADTGVRGAIGLQLDVTEYSSVEAGFAAAEKALGHIDILIHSAGGNIHRPEGSAIATLNLETWDRLIQLNLNSALYVSRAAISGMMKRRWGRIVIVGSSSAFRLTANGGGYAVAKAAAAAFTKILAREVAALNITANLIAPYFVDTPALRRVYPEDVQMQRAVDEGDLANPMHVVLKVEDQVAAILYLCKKSGRYVTGQTLHVDGGAVMR